VGLIFNRTPQNCQVSKQSRNHVSSGLTKKTRLNKPSTLSSFVKLGGRVVRVLYSSQLNQSERFWVRSLVVLPKTAKTQNSHVGTCPANWPGKQDWQGLLRWTHPWGSVVEWLKCLFQVTFTRAKDRQFDHWLDFSKLLCLRTVTWSRIQPADYQNTIESFFYSELFCEFWWKSG